MGRPRVLVAGLAAVVGVAAIVGGVRLSTTDTHSTLAADQALIPEASAPHSAGEADRSVTTDTTFDLGVLAPAGSDADATSTATSTSAAPATTSTVPAGFALVHVNNASSLPVHVFLGDDSEHQADLPAGESAKWIVHTSPRHTDSGGARLVGTGCGANWSDVDNIMSGREYHFEVKTSAGFCGNGQPMPMVVLTDYLVGTSKTITGLVPDSGHALLYVVNRYRSPVKVAVNDDSEIEWTVDPSEWGQPMLLATAKDHGDGVAVAQAAEQCGYGDSADFFQAWHSYRIEAVDGTASCSDGRAPGLVIVDLTTGTSVSLGASPTMPRTG